MALPLHWAPDPAGEAFLMGPSNAAAVAMLERWRAWPVPVGLLTGPARSGRSLLARVWAAREGGEVADDAEAWDEDALFHAWNRAAADGRPLLIVARAAPPAWAVALPDLRSRLGASARAEIRAPDDALARSLVARSLERRGLAPDLALAEWVALHAERSHAGLLDAAERLDRAAMERRRRPTIALAREILSESTS